MGFELQLSMIHTVGDVSHCEIDEVAVSCLSRQDSPGGHRPHRDDAQAGGFETP